MNDAHFTSSTSLEQLPPIARVGKRTNQIGVYSQDLLLLFFFFGLLLKVGVSIVAGSGDSIFFGAVVGVLTIAIFAMPMWLIFVVRTRNMPVHFP